MSTKKVKVLPRAKEAKNIMAKVIASSIIPICESVYLTGTSMIVTDLETCVSYPWGSPLPEVCVPFKDFATILEHVPDFEAILKDNFCVDFKSNKRLIGVTGDNPSSFPKTPFDNLYHSTANGHILADQLKDLEIALKYVTKDDLRPMMTGVYLEEGFIATDAHRLIWKKTETSYKIPFVIIPKVAKLLIMIGGDWSITMGCTSEVTEKQLEDLKEYAKKHERPFVFPYTTAVFVNDRGIKISMRVLDGYYPTFRVVIPENIKESPYQLTLQKQLLLDEIPIALQFCNRSTNQLTLHVSQKQLRIHCEDVDFGKQYDSKIEIINLKVADDAQLPFKIAFEMKLLQQILVDQEADTVTLFMSAANRALMIGEDCLLMPLMLKE